LIADKESLIEIKKDYGRAIVTGFMRMKDMQRLSSQVM